MRPKPDPQVWNASQHNVQDLTNEALLLLLVSHYCEVDSELKDFADSLYNSTPSPCTTLFERMGEHTLVP